MQSGSPLSVTIPALKIVDVGAMWMDAAPEDYAQLLQAFSCEVIGFEPNQAECRKLEAMGRKGHTYLPYFIGDGSDQTFFECNQPYTSSLLEPNYPLINQFPPLPSLMQVVATHAVKTKRLDEIPEVEGVDFLKLDVQGAEVMVLEGARGRLEQTLVIHVEVEFVPLYKNQPLFAEIDALLRGAGFLLHRLERIMKWRMGAMRDSDPRLPLNQVLWADAVYVKSFLAYDDMPVEALSKLAAILHVNYGSFDLAATALAAADKRLNTNHAPRYVASLGQAVTQASGPLRS